MFKTPSSKILPAAAFLSACACAGPPDTPNPFKITYATCDEVVLVPSDGATAAERASLTTAYEMWNALAGTKMRMDEPPSGTDGVEHLPVRFGDAAELFFGQYDDKIGEVFVNHALGDDHRQQSIVIAHELGHAFGLIHIDPDTRASVMNPGNLDVAPTSEDGATLRGKTAGCVAP